MKPKAWLFSLLTLLGSPAIPAGISACSGEDPAGPGCASVGQVCDERPCCPDAGACVYGDPAIVRTCRRLGATLSQHIAEHIPSSGASIDTQPPREAVQVAPRDSVRAKAWRAPRRGND